MLLTRWMGASQDQKLRYYKKSLEIGQEVCWNGVWNAPFVKTIGGMNLDAIFPGCT